MKEINLLCSSQLHFFEDKNRQLSHFFEDTFVKNIHFFEDNSLYTVLDSKSTPNKNPSSAHQISNKYRYLCSQQSQQKGFIQRKQTRDFGYIKSTKKHRNSSIQAKPKLEPLFHHKFSAETGSRVTRTQDLNHRSAKR